MLHRKIWKPGGVALRKESVDRNKPYSVRDITGTSVALRKESVDRNARSCARFSRCLKSLSARRAWIEIRATVLVKVSLAEVALRKESVDRNLCSIGKYGSQAGVALRKESVDRNRDFIYITHHLLQSLSARRAWIEIR